MEASGAFAGRRGRLIIKQVSCRQPRETEANRCPRRTPTAVLVLKTIPGPIAGSLRGPLLLFTSSRASSTGEQSCHSDTPYLRSPASSLQQETRQDNRRSALLPLTTTTSSTTAPPQRHHPSTAPPPSYPNARPHVVVVRSRAFAQRGERAPVSAPASACTRPDPAVIIVSHLHRG